MNESLIFWGKLKQSTSRFGEMSKPIIFFINYMTFLKVLIRITNKPSITIYINYN